MYRIERTLPNGKVVVVEDNLPSWGFAFGMLQFYTDGTNEYQFVIVKN